MKDQIRIINRKDNRQQIRHIENHVLSLFDLPSYLETSASCTLKWLTQGKSAKCHCPMPHHADSNASFHINKRENDVWVYHCFGCGAKGTMIHFCMDYLGITSRTEAILHVCKLLGINNFEDIIIKEIRGISKHIDIYRKIDNLNIMVSNQCRMLLRKNFDGNISWVKGAYEKINQAAEDENLEAIERIGYEASERLNA